MKLYRPTMMLPATVSQELREIIAPDLDAPAGSFRVVQLLIPAQPVVKVAVTPDMRFVHADGSPNMDLFDAAGGNRTYKFATCPPGAYVPLRLLPGQGVWAASESGLAELSVIIEYHEGH